MGLVRRSVTEGVVGVLWDSSRLVLNAKYILSYIMKLLLALIFIASAQSAPQHNFQDEFRAGLINIPEGCTFLSQTQTTENGVIKGEYSYEDPIGSQITVTYQVNADGSDYVERRKIIKGYGTDGDGFVDANLLTADEVVRQVTTELRPTIIQIIRTTVTQSKADLNNYDNLVETILTQLKPVVTLSVNNALATSPHGHLDAGELIARIIAELRPFVSEALRKEIKAQTPKVSEEDIVAIVIKQLQDTVVQVIKSAVASSTDSNLLSNQEKLVQTIVTQLRPVVLQSVQRAIKANNAQQYNANTLTGRIVTELTPFVRRGVGQQILELQQQQQANAGKIVTSVIQDLRPIIIKIIRESVRNYQGDLSQYGNLVETIITQLRPVVLAEVKRALATSSYKGLDAQDLSNNIIIQLRPFVEEGVQEQVRLLQEELALNADTVVKSVITSLRPIVIRVIRQTVRSSNADLSKYENLVQTIITQLRPVVLAEVTKALSSSPKYSSLNARDLTERIIVKLTPFVEEGVQEQIREIEAENRLTPEQIVDKVIAQLKPITIKVIRKTVTDSNANIDDEEALVQTIVSQLRPVVFAQVSAAIKANNANYDAQDLTNRIIIRLTPFIREGVRKEVSIQKQNNAGSLVQDIINKLNPHIQQTVKDALNSQTVTVLEESQKQTAVAGVIGKLKAIIRQAVITVMTRLQADGTAFTLSDEAIITKVNLEIKNGLLRKLLEDEIAGIIGANKPLPSSDVIDGLLQAMLPEIRRIILLEISQWRTSNPENPELSTSQQSQVLASVLGSLRGDIEIATNSFLEQSPSTISNDAVVEAVIRQFQPNILSGLQNNRIIQQVFANSNFANSDAYESLLQLIIQRLRAIILEFIRIWRASQVVITTPRPTVAPVPSGNAITNIFGTGGANSVQVETPNYSYEYNHDRALK